MPRSSRYKAYKQSKNSSKEQSTTEDDIGKIKERISKDESTTRTQRDSGPSEKRKPSSHGEVLDEHVSSKRRKEKGDIFVDGDRWNGGGDVKDTSDRVSEKELDKRDVDEKYKDKSIRDDSSKLESKNRSKRNESGASGDRKEEGSSSVTLEKGSRSESRQNSDKDSSSKAGRESKDKGRRSDKERNGGQVSRSGDAEVKVEMKNGKKHGTQSSNIERLQDNTEDSLQYVMQLSEKERGCEKRIRKKRDRSSEREKHPDDFKERDEMSGSSRSDRLKDAKHRDGKCKDGGYAGKNAEDNHHSDRKKDEKYREESEKDYWYYDDKLREDVDKDSKHWDSRYHEEGDRDIRLKEEKRHEDSKTDTKRKEKKYREGLDSRRDEKYHEDGDKDFRTGDDRYLDHGEHDDKHKGDSYRDNGRRESRHKDEKYREDVGKGLSHKYNNLGDEIDLEKRKRESKYERDYGRRSDDRSDTKHSVEDGYPADDHARRRSNEKEEYGDSKSRSTKEQRLDTGKRSSKIDSGTDRIRTTTRNADADHSSHNRRRGSPSSGSHGHRDNYRSLKPDESKYRDYSHDGRPRDSHNSVRESLEKTEKTASHSLEKLAPNDDSHLPDPSLERHRKSDIHSSPLQRTGGARDWKEGRGSRELGLDAAPGEEHLQTDNDSVSVSSPFVKNGYYSSSSRSFPHPPPFRTGVGSPVLAEDDGRNKSHSRNRRIGDPSMGRIQGNTWRGIPTWPSPMPNGFFPFPHAPPPVGFPSVMHPFPAPPIYGVRPPMELNLPSPYQMPDPDRFGPGRPMGWQNQVGDMVFSNESQMYGRPDWDHSRNMAMWDTSNDMWKGPNTAKSLEALSSGKEINSPRGEDEAGGSLQPADSAVTSSSVKIVEKNLNDSVDDDDVFTERGRKDAFGLCQAYLSKLDISADLIEPDLLSRLSNLISMDQDTASDLNDFKLLYLEDVESKTSSLSPLSVFPSIDDSVFQRSMSLYKGKKQMMLPEDILKPEVPIELVSKCGSGIKDEDDIKPENPSPTNDTLAFQDGSPILHSMSEPESSPAKPESHLVIFQQPTDECVAEVTQKSEELMPALSDAINTQVATENDAENLHTDSAGENKEAKVVDANFGGLLVNSESIMQPDSVSLSRIHHSPESTH